MALFHPFYFITPPEKSLGNRKTWGVRWKQRTQPGMLLSSVSCISPHPVIRNLTSTPTCTLHPWVLTLFINFWGVIVSILERPLQCGVRNIEVLDVYSQRSSQFDRVYAKKRWTGFFSKMHFNSSEALKGNGHPRECLTPGGLSALELRRKSQDLLESCEFCLGHTSDEGNVPWLEGKGQKSWRDGVIEKGL